MKEQNAYLDIGDQNHKISVFRSSHKQVYTATVAIPPSVAQWATDVDGMAIYTADGETAEDAIGKLREEVTRHLKLLRGE